jgi:hypothetical protein
VYYVNLCGSRGVTMLYFLAQFSLAQKDSVIQY